MAKIFLILGSANVALCIMLGAFAAHGLKAKLTEASLHTFQTGVQYHFYHSFGLLFVGLLMLHLGINNGLLKYAGFFMLAGILLFSGSLYGLSLTSLKWLGPITPLGGLTFIVAWLLVSVSVFKSL